MSRIMGKRRTGGCRLFMSMQKYFFHMQGASAAAMRTDSRIFGCVGRRRESEGSISSSPKESGIRDPAKKAP